MNADESGRPRLDWSRLDIEQRCLFPGGRFTKVNSLLSGVVAVLLTGAFYGLLGTPALRGSLVDQLFTQRGPTQFACAFLFFWSIVILGIKWLKLRLQRRAFDVPIVPAEVGFVISVGTVNRVLDGIHDAVDDPRHFLILNRIVIALSNLRNLGRVGDVDEILRSQATQDEAAIETSYSLVQGFVWAIPVLGFIGTVIGLSKAIGEFTNVLGSATDIGELSAALRGVTGGLATAFDTTLVALVAALVVQLLVTVMRKEEDEFLDAAHEYGLRHVVGRLRIQSD